MTSLTLLATEAIMWLATPEPTPSPLPAYEGDPNLITPGVVGFAVTFFIAIATVLLIIDMNRRIRRVRYREEIQEKLKAEQADGVSPAPED
jgi:hypothetical protein